jgi:hypothetical protein
MRSPNSKVTVGASMTMAANSRRAASSFASDAAAVARPAASTGLPFSSTPVSTLRRSDSRWRANVESVATKRRTYDGTRPLIMRRVSS